jgi:molybdenum cofactor cytidylyltransferase
VLTALILSGGDSTRMGFPKALLLDPEGRPFVARIVRSLKSAGLADIVVVTGSLHEQITAALEDDGLGGAVRLARNADPSRGQLSSIWTGLDARAPHAQAVLMTLVDVPLIAVATISAVVDAWRRTRAPIVRPIVDGRRGHPVVFDQRVFDELRATPADAGARVVVRAHWAESVDVPVEDRGCLVDVDTPADYERLRHG